MARSSNKQTVGTKHLAVKCQAHEQDMKLAKFMPGNKMRFFCEQGCVLTKQEAGRLVVR